MPITKIFYYLSAISIVSVAVIGVMLLFIKVVPHANCQKYKKIKTILALMMLFGSIGRMVWLLSDGGGISADLFSGIIIAVCQVQACMFVFLILILVQSQYVTSRNLLKNITPTIVFIISYIIISQFSTDKIIFNMSDYEYNPLLLLRTCFTATFLVQMIIYSRIFLTERRIAMEELSHNSSVSLKNDILWASTLFWQATIIGGVVFLYLIFPNNAMAFFVELYVFVIYIMFGVGFINYQSGMVLTTINETVDSEANTSVKDNGSDHIITFLNSSTLYLKQGVVVADYAIELNISERKLSSLIKMKFGCNFNSWVNARRIGYACILLEQNPHLTIETLAQDLGFSDKSNFSKAFKKNHGISFQEYKKDIEKNNFGYFDL